jgi:hypothetical protein
MIDAGATYATVIPGFMPGTQSAAGSSRCCGALTGPQGMRGWLGAGDKPLDDTQP